MELPATDDIPDAPLTVGAIREAIQYLPDDAPMFVTVPSGADLSIVWAHHATRIIDPPDQNEQPWITREGLELHAEGVRSRELEAEVERLNAIEARYVETLSSDEWCDNNRELEAARSSAHDVPHLLAELRNLRLRRAAGLLPGPDDIVVNREALAYVLKNVQPNNTHPEVTRANIKSLRAALSQPHPAQEQQT